MTAYVLITAEVGKLREVQKHLNGVSDITKATVVAGFYDLIAIVEADGQGQLSHVVLDVIQTTPGVVRTVTLIELT